MGIKGAPSFFQQTMATIVLSGLLYSTCELYLDDILVPADENTCIERLRLVFNRFRKFKIYLNPDKCELGAPEIYSLIVWSHF